jgi:hypothetical protein
MSVRNTAADIKLFDWNKFNLFFKLPFHLLNGLTATYKGSQSQRPSFPSLSEDHSLSAVRTGLTQL